MLISAVDNRALRSMVDRAYWTPPTFLPLTMGGGGVRVGGISHVGPSYMSPSCQLRPPSLITTYCLTPPPSKPPNNSYIPPPRSDVTLHYPLHVTLHYTAYTSHPRQQRHVAQSDNDKCQDEIDISGTCKSGI
jgi:hypothetical protein